MPTVQTYGPAKVGLDALPGARRSSAETALSEGAGLDLARAQTDETIAGVAGDVAQRAAGAYATAIKAERQRADEIALQDADNKLAVWEQKRLYDPESGALGVKGKAAMPLPETVGAEFGTQADEVAAGLSTDTQRAAFGKVRAQRQINLDLQLRRHVFGEMQQYEAGTLKAFVENNTNDAIANALDPRRVGESLDKVTTAITKSGPRLGLGPDQVQEAVGSAQSQIHLGVIDRLLTSDKPAAAKIYFDETKGQIKGEALARVEKALEEGGLRAESQKQSDAIIAAGGTLSEQRDKVKAITDPKLRDEVQARIEHNDAIQERAQREQAEGALKSAYDLVDQSHDVRSITPAAWAALPGAQRASLRSYADNLARGIATETDLPTYYGLMQRAAGDPMTFATENLLTYRGKLGDGEFKQLTGLQYSIRKGELEKADRELGGFRTHTQIIDDSLTNYGIPTTEKDRTSAQNGAVAQLRRMLDVRVQAQSELTGKKPTNDDIQRITDGLLSQSRTVKGSFWHLWPGSGPFFDTTKRLIDLTIADVPPAERTLIEQALTRARRPISDATVLDLYLENKSRAPK